MREILESLAAGDITPRQAEAALRGYVVADAGRYDVARGERRGIPEAIVADGKTDDEVIELASIALETTGTALVTRAGEPTREAVSATLPAGEELAVESSERGRWILARRGEPPALRASVAVVAGGTADRPIASETEAVLRASGVAVDRIDDVGVASLDRLLDQLDRIREADVAIAIAGREGSLPTVLAGLVDLPVIAVPAPTGYGAGGAGEAALLGALQSCTALTTVNIGAGYVAGAQAVLIARALDEARA